MACNSKESSIQFLESKGATNNVRKIIDRDLFDELNDSLTKYAEIKYGLDTMGLKLFSISTSQVPYLQPVPSFRESAYDIKRAVPNEVLFERLDQLVREYENRSDTDQPMFIRPLDREINADIKEVFESFPELASIGTAQQYSQYLDSIFPDSKVKDIVYHGTNSKFDKFNKSNLPDSGIYFDKNKTTAYGYGNVLIPAILNSSGYYYGGNLNRVNSKQIRENGETGLTNGSGNIVFEPEQIHILGSKQDIEGFKKFVATTKDMPMMMRKSSEITQDDNSYYRGQLGQVEIDGKGNLILRPQSAEWQKKLKESDKGISLSTKLSEAEHYGLWRFEQRKDQIIDNYMSSYDQDYYLEQLEEEGYSIIQINKDYLSNFEKLKGVESEDRIVTDEKVSIPEGQYKIEYYNSEGLLTSKGFIKKSEELGLPIFEFDASTMVNARSKEVASVLANRLALGLKVNYYNITEQEAREILKNSKIPYQGEPAFFFAGTVYTVGDNVNLNTVLHEFSHPLLQGIRKTNKELFNKLYAQLNGTTEGDAIVNHLKAEYPELEEGSDRFKEEALAYALQLRAVNLVNNKIESEGFDKFIKNLLYQIKQFLKSIFGNKVNVAKLDVNTSLEELANMLLEKDFIYDTDKFTFDDLVAFAKYTNARAKVLTKNASKNAITDSINTWYATNSGVIDAAKNFRGDKRTREIVKRSLIKEGTTELTPGVKKSLMGYQTLTKGRNISVDDVIENALNAEELRLKDITNRSISLVSSLEITNNSIKLIQKELSSLQRKKKFTPSDIALLGLYQNSLTRWYRSVSDIYDILKSDFNITTDNPFALLLNEISTNVSEGKKVILDLYKTNTEYFFVEITGYMSKTVEEELNTELGKILKSKMTEKEFTDFFNKIIEQKLDNDDVNKLSTKYEVPSKYINNLIDKYNYFIINETKIKDILNGKLKDVSVLNRFFESYSTSQSPIVGALSIYIENQKNQAEQRAWDNSLKFRKKLEELLPSVAEFSKWNTRAMLDLVSEKDTIAFFDSKEGKMVKKEIYTFLNEFGNGWRYDLDMLEYDIDVARRDGTPEALRKAEIALKDFKRDYMHDEYVPEYYEKDEIFNSSPIARIAWVERKLALDEYASMANKLHNESERFEEYSQLQETWRKYQLLYSLVNEDGTPKTGEDLEKAEILLKHRAETGRFYEFIPVPGSLQTAYNEFINLKKGEGKTQEEINELLENWKKQNLKLLYKPEFYEDRNRILNRLQELQSKTDTGGFNVGEAYKKISNLIYGFKDEQGQPDPAALGEERLLQIRDLQQEINDFRFGFDNKSGLTREELDELKAYNFAIKTRPLIEAEQNRYLYLVEKQTDQGLTIEEALEMQSILDELGQLTQKLPTEYYLDQLEFNLSKSQMKMVPLNKLDEFINSEEFKEILKQDQNFYDWFLTNHVTRKSWDKTSKKYVNKFERILANSVTVPKDTSLVETTTIIDEATGEEVEFIGVPNIRHSIYSVKNEYRSIPFGLTTEERKQYIGNIIDNKGNFLPRKFDGTRKGAKTDKYINKEYLKLKASNSAQFKLIEAIKEYHLQNQEGKSTMTRLYLDMPRYSLNGIVDKFQAGKYLDRYQQIKVGANEWIQEKFGKSYKEETKNGFNYNPENNLVNTDIDGNEVTYIPVTGLYALDADMTSPDVFANVMKYALSIELHSTLSENLPLVESIVDVFSSPEAQPKNLKKFRRDLYKSKGEVQEVTSKGSKNQMLGQLTSLFEKEFYGVHNQDLSEKYPRMTKVVNAMQAASSTASLAVNIPSDLKNKYGAMIQLIIEASGAEFINLKDLAAGRYWAFKAMTSWSSKKGIYAIGPGSYTTQLIELFNPVFRNKDNTGRTVTRSLYKDLVNGEWMFMHRKFGEMEVGLSLFGSFLNAQKVDQMVNGKIKSINYVDAWEKDADGIVRLKKGIHPKWNNLHVNHTVLKGDTLEKIAKQYYISVEELKAKNKISSNIELVEGDEIVIAKSEGFDLFRNQLQGTSRALFGVYDEFGKPEGNKYLLFRLWAFMRQWFTSMFTNRFGAQLVFEEGKFLPKAIISRYDWALGKTRKGYYITGFQLMYEVLKTFGGKLKYMTEEEKIAARKLASESLIIIAAALISSALFGYDDDDDDKWKKIAERSEAFGTDGYDTYGFLTNHALLLLLGVQAETTAFIPLPKIAGVNLGADDYIKMVTQTSTAFNNTVQLYIQILGDFLNMLTFNGNSRYKKDVGPYEWQEKDDYKIISDILKTVGFSGISGDPETALKNIKASGEKVR
jgi:LysM repeat protein